MGLRKFLIAPGIGPLLFFYLRWRRLPQRFSASLPAGLLSLVMPAPVLITMQRVLMLDTAASRTAFAKPRIPTSRRRSRGQVAAPLLAITAAQAST